MSITVIQTQTDYTDWYCSVSPTIPLAGWPFPKKTQEKMSTRQVRKEREKKEKLRQVSVKS